VPSAVKCWPVGCAEPSPLGCRAVVNAALLGVVLTVLQDVWGWRGEKLLYLSQHNQ